MTSLLASAIDTHGNSLAFLAWFGCLFGIYLLGRGIFLLRRKERLQNSAITSIRDAKQGTVHVGGLVEGETTMSAGVSGKPCFYYRATVWRQDSTQYNMWRKAAEETRATPFILKDSTGRILVDPRGAEVNLPRDTYEEYGKTLLATHTDIPVGLEDFLARNKVESGAALRVEEYVLGPGAEVFVNGIKTENASAKATGSGAPKPKKESHGKHTDTQSKQDRASAPESASPQVIRLTPEVHSVPATQMTMQSRVAAALTLARATASETQPSSTLRAPSISVAMEERRESAAVVSRAGAPAGPPGAPGKSTPELPRLPYIVSKSQDGSAFRISHQNLQAGESSSGKGAVALVVAGPLLALISGYILLLNFGWL